MGSYRISQLAEHSGVPASTLRFYEGAGLLPAERTAAGYRVYDDEAVRRLEFITSAKHLGLPLESIRELLQPWQEGVCSSVRSSMLPLVRARIAEAEGRIAELTAFRAHLGDAHEQLSAPAPAGACRPGCGCVAGTTAELPSPQSPTGAWQSRPVARGVDGSAADGACRAGELPNLQPTAEARRSQAVACGSDGPAPAGAPRTAELPKPTTEAWRAGPEACSLDDSPTAQESRPGCDATITELPGPLSSTEAWRSQPVACGLDGSAMEGRVRDWRALLASATSREPIPDGLRLTFPSDPDLAQRLTHLALAEQQCCSFFDFTLHLGLGSLVLSVRAPEAGAEFLADLFGVPA